MPPKRGTAPNFRPMSTAAKRLDGSRCHVVQRYVSAQQATLSDGGPSFPNLPPPKKGKQTVPQFLADVYCGQTAGLTKMHTWYEGRRRPGHIVLDGDTAPPKRGTVPLFGLCVLWPQIQVSVVNNYTYLPTSISPSTCS